MILSEVACKLYEGIVPIRAFGDHEAHRTRLTIWGTTIAAKRLSRVLSKDGVG